MTTIEERLAYERYLGKLRAGTTEYIHRTIACMKIQELKALSRMRYLKVSGRKAVLVERLMAEKW